MSLVGRKIGQRIAERRKLFGFSQARLAEALGVEPETISRLETGRSMPSLATLEAIAGALQIHVGDLFRLRASDSPEDAAIERLVWLVSRRTAKEIEFII